MTTDSSAGLTLDGRLNVTGDTQARFTLGMSTLNGVVSGAGGLTKTGTGNLILTGANSDNTVSASTNVDTPGQTVVITDTRDSEFRVNASEVTVTVTETGRLLGGLVFTTGNSRLVIDDGGAVVRAPNLFFDPTIAITGSAGNDTIINNGAINGTVNLGDGADSFISTKAVDGRINLGAGDDLVRIFDLQSFAFTSLDGGAGEDRLELINSGLASSSFTFTNIETLVLDGAFLTSFDGGSRNTSLWGLTGVRSLHVIGDLDPPVPFSNSPAFYIRQSNLPQADMQISGRAGVYLDGSTVGTVTGDAVGNGLVLWGGAQVTTAIDLGAGDDGISVTLPNGSTVGLPASVQGGAGDDRLSIFFDEGGNTAFSLAGIAGFETVFLGAARQLPGSMVVTGLSGPSQLQFFGPLSVRLEASVAPGLALESGFKSLTIAASSVVGRIGSEFPVFDNRNPNPLNSKTLLNEGEIRGIVRLEDGDDRYDGRTGIVTGAVDGGPGNDVLLGGAGPETLRGGAGADRLEGNGGDDSLGGGLGGDFQDGGDGFDYVSYAAAGSAVLADLVVWTLNIGEAAGDSYANTEGILGSAFNDDLRGTGGDNWIYGGAGSDIAYGRAGNDVLIGEAGDDTLWGNEGNDALYGGEGLDRLLAGAGADLLNGEGGFDFAHYDDATSSITVDLAFNPANAGGAVGDQLFNVEGLVGSFFADRLLGDDITNWLYGVDGNDVIDGRGGNDVLIAGNGDDFVIGGDGDDLMFGEIGDDNLFGSLGNDIIDAGAGNDVLTGGLGADVLIGNLGFDYVAYQGAAAGIVADMVAWGNNTGEAAGDQLIEVEGIIGSGFADSLRGDAGVNWIYGLGGADFIYGRGGNDVLIGGDGDDTLFGNEGDDAIYGGAGNDRIVFAAGDGRDAIFEFEAGAGMGDVIQLAASLGITSFTQLQGRMTQVGGDTLISFDAATSITIIGVAPAALVANDFLFG